MKANIGDLIVYRVIGCKESLGKVIRVLEIKGSSHESDKIGEIIYDVVPATKAEREYIESIAVKESFISEVYTPKCKQE